MATTSDSEMIDEEDSDVEHYNLPDAEDIEDPYLREVWEKVTEAFNEGDDEDSPGDEDENEEDDTPLDEEEEDEADADPFQFEEKGKSLSRLRGFIEQGHEAAVRNVASTARRIRGLKPLDVDLGTLAGIMEKEIRGLRPLLEVDLTTSMFASAMAGKAQVATRLPPTTIIPAAPTPFATYPEIPYMEPAKIGDVVASVLFPAQEPPKVHLPVVNAAVEAVHEAPVAVGGDYKETARKVQEGSFAITGDLTDKAVEDVRNELAKALVEGLSKEDFIETVSKRLEEEGSPLSPAHLENVFRTNTAAAMSNSQQEALQHPMVADAFPYASYTATHDARVRPEHRALEKLGLNGTNVYRMDDPVFQKFRPPWNFQCRCSWYPTTVEQAARKGVKEAQDWLERAKSKGGSFHQHLNNTAPTVGEHVSHPNFNPSPKFKREP